RVCDECGAHYAIGAHTRILSLVDAESFRETDPDLVSADPLAFEDDAPYAARLCEQHVRTGLHDAAVTGTATLGGQPVVVAVVDFAFMGGSMGVVVGEKVTRAAELALDRRRPLITIVASGGARMQEGMYSLLQMAKTSAAMRQLYRAGVPHLSILTHPTTGGVFASFASLGDVIVAEPGALIGFAGPRVVEQVLGKPVPPGSHTAEFLLDHGIIDAVVERHRLRGYLGSILELLRVPQAIEEAIAPSLESTDNLVTDQLSAWDTVLAARGGNRPTSLDYVKRICEQFVELHGDRESGDNSAVVAGLGSIRGHHVALIGLERGHGGESEGRRHGRPMPEGYRKAQRVMNAAARFGLPVVTLIDTPGAYPGVEAEEGGLAGEIAKCMATMSDLPVPIISAVIGEGGSGGALALAIADVVLMQSRAIYSVIAPEGAAAILYRDAGRAPEIAERLRLTARDCHAAGIVDLIVPEPPGGAAVDVDLAASLLQVALTESLTRLRGRSPERLVRARIDRYRSYGRSSTVTKPRSPAPTPGTQDA
ncbi:MAG: carboxyl transferase domain-containing protein, partial [Thermomicrobiales bacterium]